MHCRRFIAPPISRRDMLARCANGFGIVALAALLGKEAHGADLAEYPEDLSKWARMPPTNAPDFYWGAANRDTEHEWTVFLRGDRPAVRLRARQSWPQRQEAYPPMPFEVEQGSTEEGRAGEWFSTKVSDGWIIGFNKGEWGGALWWYSPDGKKRSRISKDQVIGFIETDAGLLALDGIAHGLTNRGQLIRLAKGKDNLWHSERFVDLEGAPEAAVKGPDGTLLVATYDRLLRVDLGSKKREVLAEDACWQDLYPKSMILTPSGTVYLGMRHGVAEIAKEGTVYKVTWLIPDAEYDRGFEDRDKGFR
jgi:hypothetical protein